MLFTVSVEFVLPPSNPSMFLPHWYTTCSEIIFYKRDGGLYVGVERCVSMHGYQLGYTSLVDNVFTDCVCIQLRATIQRYHHPLQHLTFPSFLANLHQRPTPRRLARRQTVFSPGECKRPPAIDSTCSTRVVCWREGGAWRCTRLAPSLTEEHVCYWFPPGPCCQWHLVMGNLSTALFLSESLSLHVDTQSDAKVETVDHSQDLETGSN